MSQYLGVNFNNLRKALYLLYFGIDNGACNDFSSPKYQYIIPMQGSFDNPMQLSEHDTYIMYWIVKDESLTEDDYVVDEETNIGYNRQKCVATVQCRFIGKEAEDWARALRHLCKRKGVTDIFEGVCNGFKLVQTMPITPRRVSYYGINNEIAFDVRFKLYYDECISTRWQPLTGVDFTVHGEVSLDDNN